MNFTIIKKALDKYETSFNIVGELMRRGYYIQDSETLMTIPQFIRAINPSRQKLIILIEDNGAGLILNPNCQTVTGRLASHTPGRLVLELTVEDDMPKTVTVGRKDRIVTIEDGAMQVKIEEYTQDNALICFNSFAQPA